MLRRRSHKRTSMGPSRSCWKGTSALQPEETTSKGTRVSCVSGNLFYDPRIYKVYLTRIFSFKHV